VSVTEVDAAYTREAERETLLGVVERTLLGAPLGVLFEEDMDMDVFIIIIIFTSAMRSAEKDMIEYALLRVSG